MNLTLESLLQGLEKQAGLVDLDKRAEEDPKKDEEHEKKEDAVEADAEKKTSEAKEDLKESENDFSKLKKMNEKEESKDEKEESKDEKEQTKEAQEAGAEMANFIMQKVASAQLTNKETEMNKQIAESGKALADALLVKLANAGDQTTLNGIPEGVAPNKNQIDNAQFVAEHDSYIKPMPTGDGIKNQGTINQIFDAIVADTHAQGATDFDAEHAENGPTAPVEGAAEQMATPNQVQTESVEKTAAVISLVNSGIDFDSAVSMVKAAAEEIEAEEYEQVKQAAFYQLVESGVDFDLAAAMVKSAAGAPLLLGATRAAKAKGYAINAANAVKDTSKNAWGSLTSGKALDSAVGGAKSGFESALAGVQSGAARVKADTLRVPAMVKALRHPERMATGLTRGQVAKDAIMNNRAVQIGAGAIGATGLVGGGYALTREKKAAVSSLCEAGVDFETAVELVQAKSQELYGA